MPAPDKEDRRKAVEPGKELTEEEICAKIAERNHARQRARNQTKGGLILGTVGVSISGYAGVVTQNIWMTIIGFVMALIGFGFSSPKEAFDMARSIISRNGRFTK